MTAAPPRNPPPGAPRRNPFTFGMQLTGAADAASWLDLARRAEVLGYTTVSLPDHFGDQFAPFAALGAVAAATSRVRLSMGVLVNDFRHPVVLAKEAATLDVVSGGRLDLGLGAGWLQDEFDAAGIAFGPAAERIERLGEAVRIVRALLRGERVHHTGRWYTIAGVTGLPRAVQRPAPPILLGGGGQKMLALAGREADIVSVVTANAGRRLGAGLGRDATLERARVKVGWVREAAGTRVADIVLHTRVSVATVTDTAREIAARARARPTTCRRTSSSSPRTCWSGRCPSWSTRSSACAPSSASRRSPSAAPRWRSWPRSSPS